MKMKFVYIVCFLLCFSCANDKKADRMLMKEEAVENEDIKVTRSDLIDDADKKNDVNVDFYLEGINTEIEEKLQANYEAKVLATKHPEFQAAIEEQLANSNKFDFTLSDSIETIEIRDILFLDDLQRQNDSVSTQKVVYSYLINSANVQKDSALVVIKHNMIKIDNSLKMNTSFSFEKLD